jgi:predicted nuclease of predicted toxin-antitoxin system
MTIKFYTDTHIATAVAAQLKQHGVDIVRCQDVGRADDLDEPHLEYAAQQKRSIVTCDRDFNQIHNKWLAQGKEHAGIFCITNVPYSIGNIVSELLFWHYSIEAGAATLEQDVYNQLLFIKGL